MSTNRVHVITGGGGGMGLATARLLAATGALILADQSESALAAAKATLAAEGIAAETCMCDVADAASVSALAALVSPRTLGALVHIAGIDDKGEVQRIIQVNVGGTLLILDAFEPLLSEGSVGICIASMGGHMVPPAHAAALTDLSVAGLSAIVASSEQAYVVSKYAVMQLVQQRAKRWGTKGARLVSLSPGVITTNMGNAALKNPQVQGMIGLSSVGRPGRADEIASVIAFLVSDSAAYITGTDILVDGGVIAGIRNAG
jgi:NAD(P)-dependent dehydrogenase (short-subunit alcohol dehydrogenase family)